MAYARSGFPTAGLVYVKHENGRNLERFTSPEIEIAGPTLPVSRLVGPLLRAVGHSSAGYDTTTGGSPSSSSRYQTGTGTPKKRWREISQSPLRPSTQDV